jgi:hypothetical protein
MARTEQQPSKNHDGDGSAARSDADRAPELDLDEHEVEWTTLPEDVHEALLVDGGGLDGGDGAYFANAGDDVHVVGSLAPLVPGAIGCIVLRPDGSRRLARALHDPLAEQPD